MSIQLARTWAVTWVTAAAAALVGCGGSDGGSGNGAISAGPTITASPTAAAVNAGQTATFSVSATGTGTLAYQWQLNGVDIAGATAASYSTPAAAAADSGKSYTVKVTDSNGTTTSAAALLTVNAVAASGVIDNSQAGAASLVATANSSVTDIRQAGSAGLLPKGAQTFSLPGGVTSTGSIACSTLGGGNGSGSIDYTYNYADSTSLPTSYSYRYNSCSFTSAGLTFSANGSGSLVYARFASATDYSFTISYNMTYSYSGNGYSDSGTVVGSQSCTTNAGGLPECSFTIGNNQVKGVSTTASGSVTIVNSATVSNADSAYAYSGWSYDANARRATAGTVTVTDRLGNSATLTATGNGYTVVIHYGGNTFNYTVSFS